MSVAVFDEELQHAVEPGTPTAAARLATVAAAREAGLPCGVFLMPVLPYLTDTVAHLDRALAAIKAADASFVLWSALHLKPGVKEWYLDWLGRTHPQHLPAYRAMYGTGTYAPKAYRRWLADRIRSLIAKHGLVIGSADDATGAVRSRALGIVRAPTQGTRTVQPALF
jgi:DNA repair photolyase